MSNAEHKPDMMNKEKHKLGKVSNEEHKLGKVSNKEHKLGNVSNEEHKHDKVSNEEHKPEKLSNEEHKPGKLSNEEHKPDKGNNVRHLGMLATIGMLESEKLEHSKICTMLNMRDPGNAEMHEQNVSCNEKYEYSSLSYKNQPKLEIVNVNHKKIMESPRKKDILDLTEKDINFSPLDNITMNNKKTEIHHYCCTLQNSFKEFSIIPAANQMIVLPHSNILNVESKKLLKNPSRSIECIALWKHVKIKEFKIKMYGYSCYPGKKPKSAVEYASLIMKIDPVIVQYSIQKLLEEPFHLKSGWKEANSFLIKCSSVRDTYSAIASSMKDSTRAATNTKTVNVPTRTDNSHTKKANATATAQPKPNSVLPKTNTLLPKTNAVLPNTDTVIPKTNSVLHKLDSILPKTNALLPKSATNALLPKTATNALLPKTATNALLPKTATTAVKRKNLPSSNSSTVNGDNLPTPPFPVIGTDSNVASHQVSYNVFSISYVNEKLLS